jgi:hypothetical protein
MVGSRATRRSPETVSFGTAIRAGMCYFLLMIVPPDSAEPGSGREKKLLPSLLRV